MGSADVSNATPAHPVTLSDFQMSRNIITNAKYLRFVSQLKGERFFLLGQNPQDGQTVFVARGGSSSELQSISEGELSKWAPRSENSLIEGGLTTFINTLKIVGIRDHAPSPGFDRPTQPATLVDWFSAAIYAFMHGCLLPTEAQWEYGARGEEGRPFGTRSGELTREEAHYDTTEPAEVDDLFYPSMKNGLRHMTANVWEWNRDWFDRYSNNPLNNPLGPPTGKRKILRGGSYLNYNAAILHAAFRNGARPGGRNANISFRIVAPNQ